MRILVIDNDIHWCETVQDIFEPLGYGVEIALNTTEGMKKLKETKFDVLILDKNVPREEDGLEMLGKIERFKADIKNKDNFATLEVIMLTAFGSVDSTKEALRSGAYDYVEKEEGFEKELVKYVKEIELMKIFGLPSSENIKYFLSIDELKSYFDNLLSYSIQKDSFIYSLFAVYILFCIKRFNKEALVSLISKTKILDEIPEFCNLDEEIIKIFYNISEEIIKKGHSNDLKYLHNLIIDLFEKENTLIPRKITEIEQWYQVYNLLSHLEIIIDEIREESFVMNLRNYLSDKRKEYNLQFADFIEGNYAGWIKGAINKEETPTRMVLSPGIIDKYIVPLLDRPTYFVIFDGMRLDQWIVVREIIKEDLKEDLFKIKEELYLSILPTTTTYSRNSLLSGLFPIEIANKYNVGFLKTNSYEKTLLSKHKSLEGISIQYLNRAGEELNKDKLDSIIKDKESLLKILLFNFIDDLGHLMDKIGASEYDFRKHIQASYKNSVMQKTLLKIAKTGGNIVITTDHGNKRVFEMVKLENHLSIESKHSRYAMVDKKVKGKRGSTVTILTPSEFGLPGDDIYNYVFAKGEVRFLGKAKTEESEFVHGGISMEEMIVPVAVIRREA